MAALEMKFVLMLALLAYAESTFGQKDVCATPGNPITLTVHGKQGMKGEKGEPGTKEGAYCQCNLQDPNKPSAHIEAANNHAVTYQANTVIKDWSVSNTHSHLAGGMKYHNGKLTVPTRGRYFIYAHLFYHSKGNGGRVFIRVNNNVATMVQPLDSGTGQGTVNTGGVFNLNAGDVISLDAAHTITVFMYSYHSYFGAFLI